MMRLTGLSYFLLVQVGGFQFLYDAINSRDDDYFTIYVEEFQFLYDAINSASTSSTASYLGVFQFLYDAINSTKVATIVMLKLISISL